MNDKTEQESSGYRIGSVARLTGISADTLRVWERRYAAVTPQRSPSGGRLYDADDIARLRLIKQLVDSGDSIGTVASLGRAALEARAAQTRPALPLTVSAEPCRLVVIGESLGVKMKADEDRLSGILLVASYENLRAFQSESEEIQADVLLIEQSTLQADTALRVVDWMNRIHAAYAIVVYRFAARDSLQRLPRSRCSALRAPVDAQTIHSQCIAIHAQRAALSASETEEALLPHVPVPSRRYDEATLAKLATISTTVKCECPRHLAELITSLSAFEQYSTECESRSPKDAALHAHLNATAAHARSMIEMALSRVIEAEKIEL
jgi:DNA-binding transcriptional MerR regulator